MASAFVEDRVVSVLERRLREAKALVNVRLWNGRAVAPPAPAPVTVTVRSPQALMTLANPSMGIYQPGAPGAGYFIGMWGRGSAAASGALARHRERARAQERIREARLAKANLKAGTRGPPRRPPPGRPRPPRQPPPASVPANSGDGGEGA